jgi:hypothetical protein
LERGWSIAETEGHDEELVVAISCPKRRFWDVFVLDANLPVAGTQVEFGEVFAPSKSVKEVFDAWERIFVLDCDVVECAIVNTHTEATILLFDKEDRCSIR